MNKINDEVLVKMVIKKIVQDENGVMYSVMPVSDTNYFSSILISEGDVWVESEK